MKKSQSKPDADLTMSDIVGSVSPVKFRRVITSLVTQPMAVQPAYLDLMLAVVDDHVAGVQRDFAPEVKRNEKTGLTMVNGVGLVDINGVIINRAGILQRVSGATSPQAIKANMKAAFTDPDCLAVCLVCNSPGGQVAQVPELADWMFAMKQGNPRPLVACVEGLCASAAYWLASQADEIFVTPSSIVGSVGIITKIVDESRQEKNEGKDSYVIKTGKNKAMGVGTVTDEQIAILKEIQAEYFGMFIEAITRGRGAEPSADVLTGREYTGKQAIAAGIADKIGNLDDVILAYGKINPADDDEDEE